MIISGVYIENDEAIKETTIFDHFDGCGEYWHHIAKQKLNKHNFTPVSIKWSRQIKVTPTHECVWLPRYCVAFWIIIREIIALRPHERGTQTDVFAGYFRFLLGFPNLSFNTSDMLWGKWRRLISDVYLTNSIRDILRFVNKAF